MDEEKLELTSFDTNTKLRADELHPSAWRSWDSTAKEKL